VTALLRRHTTAHHVAILLLLTGAAVSLLPRIALTFYAYPSADDFCIVNETLDDGFWYMQVHSYLTWTGRYSAVFLESIISQFDLIDGYPWVALLTLLMTLAAIHALVATVIGRDLSRLRVAAISLTAAAVFIGGLPSTVEAFYWMPGAASYQWGIITYLFWLSLLILRFRRGDGRERPVWQTALIVILSLVLPGFNEVSAPIVLATIGGFILAERWRGRGNDRFLLMLLGVIVLVTVVCFVAPGNGNRSGGYPALASRHNLGYALVETARQTVRFVVNYGSYPALWLGAVAAWWWAFSVRGAELNWVRRPVYVASVLLCLVSVLYLTLFPLYWEYGEMNFSGEGRTYNVTFTVLCAIVLTVTGSLVSALAGPSIAPGMNVRPGWIDVGVPVLLAALLMASPSTRQVYQALRVAPAYLHEERARTRELRRAPREGVVFVDRLTVRPPGLFWGDVEGDQSHWINICIAKYYGLQFVRSRM
jgi:hypothetical protein